MERFLQIKNQYSEIQLTDDATAYYFLKQITTLSTYYVSTSSKCECTWNDGKVTGEAYNYCLNHGIDEKLVFVIKNESSTEARLCVAPLDFVGTPSFHVSVTGCSKEVANNLKVYIFSGNTSQFIDKKCGLAIYSKNGDALYNSSWLPLKISSAVTSNEAINQTYGLESTCGIILNSGYRNPSSETITTGTWTETKANSVQTGVSYIPSVKDPPVMSPVGPQGSYQYGNTINTFPKEITYQGYILSAGSISAQTFTAKAPIETTVTNDKWSESHTETQWVDRWDDCASNVYDPCATESLRYDPCASTRLEYDPCADKNIITGACSPGMVTVCVPGMVKECQGGMVCQGGIVSKLETVEITTIYETKTTTTEPTMDNPSLFYGMEAYPDGTLFIRSSGTSTIAVVDLKNYSV